MISRHLTKEVSIGSVTIGGNNPIAIQSMTNTDTLDVNATVAQINALADAGCDIVRVTVPKPEAVEAFAQIKKQSRIPVVADIHFDYRLAIGAIEAGADKIRINPGNIEGEDKLKQIIAKAKEKNIPIRIGVNAGSTTKDLVDHAVEYCEFFEQQNFTNIVLSLKSSSVQNTLDAYRRITKRRHYPLHVGITEAGTEHYGIIKSSVGIGALLAEGLGDTVRVSLTADPVKEIETARYILRSLGFLEMPELISCPTCGRTEINIIGIADEVERRLKKIKKNITVAVMGCVVNGPGEAAHADFGIAGGKGQGILFAKGKKIKIVPEAELVNSLFELIAEE
jgi:(E)-4-hydroxy-3-methylbut-2-enyl-diphosphate synthase